MTTTTMRLDSTMGAALIGVVVAAALYGVSCIQAWYYFSRYTEDRIPLKLLVCAVLLFDTVHQALISHTVYTYLVTNFDNPAALGNLVWSLLVEVVFNGFTALLVQSFLALRVWRLSNHNILLTSCVLALVVGEFGCVIAYTSQALQLKTYEQLAALKGLSIAVNALAAAGDVLIAASLCAMLHHSRTGFHRSDTMINKLIMFSVNTGVLTSLCAVASLISIVVAGHTFLYIGFFFCLGRLYSNSLLATLNARKMIRGAADGVNTSGDNISLSMRSLPTTTVRTSPQRSANISIKIDKTMDYKADRDRSSSWSDSPRTSCKDIE